jgi:hypothetical protein
MRQWVFGKHSIIKNGQGMENSGWFRSAAIPESWMQTGQRVIGAIPETASPDPCLCIHADASTNVRVFLRKALIKVGHRVGRLPGPWRELL